MVEYKIYSIYLSLYEVASRLGEGPAVERGSSAEVGPPVLGVTPPDQVSQLLLRFLEL